MLARWHQSFQTPHVCQRRRGCPTAPTYRKKPRTTRQVGPYPSCTVAAIQPITDTSSTLCCAVPSS